MKRTLLALVAVLLLPAQAALAACEFNGRYGVYPGIFSSEWEAGQDIRAFNEASGLPVTFGGTFHHLYEGGANTLWILDQVASAGATPVAHLEVPYTAAEMADGGVDEDVRRWAQGVDRWLGSDPSYAVIVAPLQEMNGDWVSWGMDPPSFITAYRRVVEIFREMGMDESRVRFMFAPNSVSVGRYTIADYWPGEDVVDIVGISAYNFGHEFGDWASVDDILLDETDALQPLAWDKPFLVSQIGTSQEGGDREGWLTDMFDFVARHPNLVGFIYFNFDKETNWTIWDGEQVAEGWIRALDDERVLYEYPLDVWFRPGPIPFRFNVGTEYPRPEALCLEPIDSTPTRFTDVPPDYFYTDPIAWLSSVGVVDGYGDGSFRPDQTVSRAEALSMLWRLACAPSDIPSPGFVDVGDEWFQDAIEWAVSTETARGYPDGTFRPSAELTRAEVSTMMWRLHDCPEPASSQHFGDVSIRDYYGGAVGWVAEGRISTGTSTNVFSPTQPVTRGELAAFLYRMANNWDQ